MKLSDFDYELPKELIAQYPLRERDAARLLVLRRKDGRIEHSAFRDLTDYLKKDDLVVLNDTKVLACRLKGARITGGKVELLLLKHKTGLTFDALIKPSRVKLREKIIFNSGQLVGQVSAKNEITFDAQDLKAIYDLGVMPLPPYIKRAPEDLDDIFYQTVYARQEGAIASPTAGLHFTKELIEKMLFGSINVTYLTLHVGEATFRPVKLDDITKHRMPAEYFRMPDETAGSVEKARLRKNRVIAVGTTSLRALETYALGKAQEGDTDLFIYPGYKFKIADCLLTNFHLPKTTLFMLVCAFAGTDLMQKAYQEAVDKKYRFYSYGDAMLII